MTQAPIEDSPFRLDGQIAFVTGATGGLGAAIVVALARAGADVALADLPSRQAAADVLVADIAALGRRGVSIPIDVTSVASIEAAVSTAEDHLGPIGVAVANAGVNIRKPGLDLTESEWDSVLDINLKGVFFYMPSGWAANGPPWPRVNRRPCLATRRRCYPAISRV